MSVSFTLVWRYILRHPELLKRHVNRDALVVRNRRYTLGLFGYPIATAIGLVSVPVFLALMLALALLFLLPTPEVRG
jgi:hypothetical protein